MIRVLASLVKSIFSTIFIIAGTVTVMIIFAVLYTGNVTPSSDLVIDRDRFRGWGAFSAEARSLYPALRARSEEINTPLSDDPTPIYVAVAPGETAIPVGQRLQALGLISDAALFNQLLRYNGIDTRLKAGEYTLRRTMTMREIASALFRGRSAQQAITIFPGWRMEEVAESLEINGIMDGDSFLRVAQRGTAVRHAMLADRPLGMSYEGYLFPGTYYVPEDITPEEMIVIMLDAMVRYLPPNVFSLAQAQGLTFYEVLILASIVERETALDHERPLVASVYLNRLDPTSSETHLRADPTVQYAMGYQPNTGQWWKSPVTLDEYPAVDSPYNTYLYPGLPPGPIANPSFESIMAVLRPAQTDYLFFVCRYPGCRGGEHVFAETYEEHLRNAAIYWGQ